MLSNNGIVMTVFVTIWIWRGLICHSFLFLFLNELDAEAFAHLKCMNLTSIRFVN